MNVVSLQYTSFSHHIISIFLVSRETVWHWLKLTETTGQGRRRKKTSWNIRKDSSAWIASETWRDGNAIDFSRHFAGRRREAALWVLNVCVSVMSTFSSSDSSHREEIFFDVEGICPRVSITFVSVNHITNREAIALKKSFFLNFLLFSCSVSWHQILQNCWHSLQRQQSTWSVVLSWLLSDWDSRVTFSRETKWILSNSLSLFFNKRKEEYKKTTFVCEQRLLGNHSESL